MARCIKRDTKIWPSETGHQNPTSVVTSRCARPSPRLNSPRANVEKSWLRFRPLVGCCAGHFRPQTSVQIVPPGGTKWVIWGVN
jgi:hypothetical protein